MSRHGENIRKRKDGRWEGRYPVYSEEKGRKVYRSVYGGTYEETREKLAAVKKLLKEYQRGKTEPPYLYGAKAEKMMFDDAAMEWLCEVKNGKKLSTYVKYSQVYRSHLKKAFQDMRLYEMTDTSMKERISESMSDSLQKSVYCVLNQILQFISQHYLISMPYIRKEAAGVRNKPIELFTKSEQSRLFPVLSCKIDIYKTAILLSLYTGLRLGEVCALKWADIDFKNRILSVKRTVQRICVEGCRTKTILLETEPKSGYSRREIPLSAGILKLLLRFQSGNEYVFGGNKPMEPRTLQYHFKKILEESGLPAKNFHILRHTFATNCIEGGTDVKSLSEILGHSDVQITLNRYVHPTMETKRRQMDVLSLFYGQIHDQVSQGNHA